MKYYIIAGEASGDLHGSNLMKGLKASDSSAEFRIWGGDLMAAEGGTLVRHYKETAVMGFVEVLMSLNKITKNLRLCKKDLLDYKPDILILIDYPGFNFRMAKFAKKNNIILLHISKGLGMERESRKKPEK
jgi:lipid-A-disaccharide synthase